MESRGFAELSPTHALFTPFPGAADAAETLAVLLLPVAAPALILGLAVAAAVEGRSSAAAAADVGAKPTAEEDETVEEADDGAAVAGRRAACGDRIGIPEGGGPAARLDAEAEGEEGAEGGGVGRGSSEPFCCCCCPSGSSSISTTSTWSSSSLNSEDVEKTRSGRETRMACRLACPSSQVLTLAANRREQRLGGVERMGGVEGLIREQWST